MTEETQQPSGDAPAPAPTTPEPPMNNAEGSSSFDLEGVGEDTVAVFQQYIDQGGEVAPPPGGEANAAPAENEAPAGDAALDSPPESEEPDAHAASTEGASPLPPNPLGEPEKAEADPDADLIRKFRLLSDESNKLRKEQEALNSKREELEKAQQLQERLRTDPMAVLQEMGWDYAALTDKVIEGDKANPVNPQLAAMKAEMAAMKAEMEQAKANMQAAQQQASIQAYKDSIPAQIKAKAAEYPYVAGVYTDDQMKDTVFSVMENVYNSDQRVLSLDEAVGFIENELRRQAEVLQGVQAPSQTNTDGGAVPATSPAATGGSEQKPSQTLTNSNTQSSQPPSDKDELLPFEESLQRMSEALAAAAAED